jgi:hypothetical protein
MDAVGRFFTKISGHPARSPAVIAELSFLSLPGCHFFLAAVSNRLSKAGRITLLAFQVCCLTVMLHSRALKFLSYVSNLLQPGW